MYGVGSNVANVTANGERIVKVSGLGSEIVTYYYDNLKTVDVEIEDGKIIEVLVSFYDENENILWCEDYNDLTEEEKEKYIPEAEYKIITKKTLKGYEAENEELGEFEELEIKKTGCGCSIL